MHSSDSIDHYFVTVMALLSSSGIKLKVPVAKDRQHKNATGECGWGTVTDPLSSTPLCSLQVVRNRTSM